MANSHLPMLIPDVDYDDDVEDESTSTALEDDVFNNPLYHSDLQIGTERGDEGKDNDIDQQPNDNNNTADVFDVARASQPEYTIIIDHQAEVTVGDVQFADEKTAPDESNVGEHKIQSVADVVSGHDGIDVEKDDFSSAGREKIDAEARRIRERELTICVSMFIVVVICVIVSLVIFFAVSAANSASSTTESPLTSEQPSDCSRIVSREEWGARTAVETEPLPVPTPYLLIHHTDTVECTTSDDCMNAVRGIQNYHMDTNGWWDIGYNFLIGGDGYVYEGRGWDIKGAHATEYNQYSIGVVLIGRYANKLPTSEMLDTLDRFIDCLTRRSKLDPCYTLYGHRQAVATECPGEMFYNYLQDHPHWRFTNDSLGNPNPLTPCDR